MEEKPDIDYKAAYEQVVHENEQYRLWYVKLVNMRQIVPDIKGKVKSVFSLQNMPIIAIMLCVVYELFNMTLDIMSYRRGTR